MTDFKFPFAHDKATNKPSVTLFFAYIAFWQTFTLIIVVACNMPLIYSLVASFVLFLICIFFYRARGLDKLKVGREGFEISNDKTNDNVKQQINESSEKEGWGSASGKAN